MRKSRGAEIQPNAPPPPRFGRTSATCSATRRHRPTTARTPGSAKHISQEQCDPSWIEESLGSPRAWGCQGGKWWKRGGGWIYHMLYHMYDIPSDSTIGQCLWYHSIRLWYRIYDILYDIPIMPCKYDIFAQYIWCHSRNHDIRVVI